MESATRRPPPPTDSPGDDEAARRHLAEQVARRIQQEMASDLDRLRARLGLGSASPPAPVEEP